MIQCDYDPKLVEQAVFLAVRFSASAEARLHAALDSIYDLEDTEQRDAAFRRTYAEWFSRLELGRPMNAWLAERPLSRRGVGRAVVREAPRSREQFVDLFVRPEVVSNVPESRTLVIQLCPQALVDPNPVTPWMRRELLHIADMLDDRFGYVPASIEGLPATQNLVRDRYRVLWDIYVEARLLAEGLVDEGDLQRLRSCFQRAFSLRGIAPRPSVFDRVLGHRDATHQRMLEWALRPSTLLSAGEGGPDECGTGGTESAGCPMCDLPTFDWYRFRAPRDDAVVGLMSGVRPGWSVEDGACRQCVETYASMMVSMERQGSP